MKTYSKLALNTYDNSLRLQIVPHSIPSPTSPRGAEDAEPTLTSYISRYHNQTKLCTPHVVINKRTVNNVIVNYHL